LHWPGRQIDVPTAGKSAQYASKLFSYRRENVDTFCAFAIVLQLSPARIVYVSAHGVAVAVVEEVAVPLSATGVGEV
jgi:hypothetical protein